MLVEANGHNASSESTCRQWFRRFKNHTFDLEDKEHEEEAILDEELS